MTPLIVLALEVIEKMTKKKVNSGTRNKKFPKYQQEVWGIHFRDQKEVDK
jgi:hypothetical protein